MRRKLLLGAIAVVTVFFLASIWIATDTPQAIVFWGALDAVLAAIWFNRKLSQRGQSD